MASTAKKRTSDQRAADRAEILRLRVRGVKSHQEIADRLNQGRPVSRHISRQVVTYEMSKARKEWARYAAAAYYHAELGQYLATIDHVLDELWQAWEKSKAMPFTQDVTEEPVTEKTADGERPVLEPDPDGRLVPKHKPVRRRRMQKGPGYGDPRIMARIIEVLKEKADRIGLGNQQMWHQAMAAPVDEQAKRAEIFEQGLAEFDSVESELALLYEVDQLAAVRAALATGRGEKLQWVEKRLKASNLRRAWGAAERTKNVTPNKSEVSDDPQTVVVEVRRIEVGNE